MKAANSELEKPELESRSRSRYLDLRLPHQNQNVKDVDKINSHLS